MLSLKNIGQRLLDSTTLDEKVGNFFRPKTGTLASTGRKWAQELAAKPAPSWIPQQVQQTAQNISDRGGFNRLKQEFTSNPAQFTPLSMKSAAVDTGRKLGSEDLGYGLRGALSLTPFQSAGKLTPKLSAIQQTTAPTTSRQQMAQSLGQTLYGTALTAPLSAGKTVLKSVGNVARNLAVGGTTGALMQGGSDLLTGNFSKDSLKQGALSGLQNSWVLPVTNSLTDAAILKLFPKAGLKITGAGVTDPFKLGKIKEGFGRLLTQSLAQVPAENTAFTFLNQLDDKTKGSFTENWMNNLPGNIVGNILSAGVSGSVNVFSNPQSRKVVTDAMKKTVDEWNTPVTMMGGEKMPMWKYKMMYETKPGFARLDLGVGKDTPKLSVEPVGGKDLLSEARKYGSEEKFIDEVRRGNLNNVLGKTETLNPREIISDKNKLAKIDQGRMKELPIRKDSFKYALENPQKDNILVHEYTGLNGEKRRYVVDGTHRLYAAIAKKEPINATVIRTNKKEDLDKYLSSVYKQSSPSPLGGKVVAQGGLSDVKPTIKGVTSTTKPRGLTTSVQEAPNINPTVKGMVDNSYTPKTNPELMGEARAMLSELPEGSKIDFKGVKNVDQKVAATIQEAINLQNAGDYKAAANLYNNLSEQGTELGRGVQAFSLLQKMTPEAISYSIASKIKKFNSLGKQQIPELNGEQTKLIADQVKVIDSLTGREKNIAINELEKTLNSFIPSSMLDKVAAVWKAGLLTSLRTHERNLIGNTIHGTMEVAKDYLASPVDALLGMKTGKRTLTATTQGLGSGVNRETGQQMVDMVKLGYDPSEQINKFDYKQITWADTPIQQFFKKYTDVVFRTLGASDKPFYNSALAHSLWNQAGAEAINAGQKGNKAFIENLVKNATEEMMKTAISDANIATFKDKNAISGVANAIKNALSKNEWSKFGGEIVMPFTGVPSSVFSQIKNYSPIGLAQGIIKAGRVLAGQVPELQRQAAQEMGRGVIGTGIYGLGAYLMSKGLMTGQPKDAEEQRLWDLQNKPRNSVMVNGKWRSLNSLGPETFILLAGGKLQEELGQKDGSISNYAGTLGKDVLDQSFVQGINAPVNAITDPKRYAKSYVGNLISSTVPNVVKDSSKAFDSKQRETNSIMDYTKLSIPGLRNTLVEKRDSLGNVMKQEPTGFSAFVDVFNSKTPVKNQVTDELSRLQQAGAGYVPSKLTKNQTIAGVKKDLTPQELNQLEAKVGPELTAKMTALINSPGYKSLSDEDKATALQSITTSTRKIARAGGLADTVTAPADASKVFTLVNQETGSVKEIDLSKPIEAPVLTGNTELDKKLMSGYKGDITSRINDIVKLYEDGQIKADDAEKLINELKTTQSKLSGGKKPKKITIKTTKAPRVSFKLAKPTKMSVIKAPTSKRARISFKNYKPAKIRV